MTSRAKELFAQIVEGGAAYIRSMVEQKTAETHYLEFKGGKIQKDTKCIKEAWSEALSGFANTEGGILLFGVRASRTPHPDNPSLSVDAANEVELVNEPASLRQFLRDRLLEATIPPVSGVEIRDLYDPTEAGVGFVACYVPEGDDKPYRAELHQSRNYIQRVDDRFVLIQHSLLRTMFYPRLRPRLIVEIEPKIEQVDSEVEVIFRGIIENCGTATARELWIFVKSNLRLRHQTMYSFTAREGMIADGVAWEAFQSIHPGAKVPVFWYELKLKQHDPIPAATFSVQLHSQHQLAQDVKIELSTDDILDGRKVSAHAEVRDP